MVLHVVGVATKLLNRTKSIQTTITYSNQKSKTVGKEENPHRKETMHRKKNLLIPKIMSATKAESSAL